MTFLQKSYRDSSKVERPDMVPMSYEGSNDDEELEMVPVNNQCNNSNYNVVSDSKSNDEADKNYLMKI